MTTEIPESPQSSQPLGLGCNEGLGPNATEADLAALKADVEKHTAGLRDILETTSPEFLLKCAVSMLANRDSAARYADAEIARLRLLTFCGCGDQFAAHDPGTCGNCCASMQSVQHGA